MHMGNVAVVCRTLTVCEKTEVSSTKGLLTMSNIYPELFVKLSADEVKELGKGPKNIDIPMELVIFWNRQKGMVGEIEMDFKVEFVDPQGKVLLNDISGQVRMHEKLQKFYSIIKMSKGLPCANPGVHAFKILTGDGAVLLEEMFEIKMFDQDDKQILGN